MVSSNIQATLEQFPIHVLTKLNLAWLQWSYENWYFQVDKPLRLSECLIVERFLVLLLLRQSIVAWVNCILVTYRKGAVCKKGDKILAGSLAEYNTVNVCPKVNK